MDEVCEDIYHGKPFVAMLEFLDGYINSSRWSLLFRLMFLDDINLSI